MNKINPVTFTGTNQDIAAAVLDQLVELSDGQPEAEQPYTDLLKFLNEGDIEGRYAAVVTFVGHLLAVDPALNAHIKRASQVRAVMELTGAGIFDLSDVGVPAQ